ncbi:unnamed protein product [Fraxinus pennsylvanica]|uniref:Uncharacterized protein n=1 Tax=Fraxinus pennsylvanica TaxID=56036 RepID=A0AAD1ZQ30_9LAMI|nr:unnamed protein product [Fraxinus pennsylvanica]
MWSIFKFQRLVDGHNVLSLSDTSYLIRPIATSISAVAPPPTKTIPKRLVLKSRRTKRKSLSGDNDDGEENGDLFFIDGDGDSFWGGGSGEGGKRWNFDGFGGANWGESLNNSFYDPAFMRC